MALQKFARISPLIPACGSLSVPIRVIRGFPPASARHCALADEADELLFDDDAGHALHFGEAAGEGGGGLVQRDYLLHGLFGQFLAGSGEKFHGLRLVTRVQIPAQRAEQGADPRAASVQARQDFLENFVVEVRLPLAGFPCGFIRSQLARHLEIGHNLLRCAEGEFKSAILQDFQHLKQMFVHRRLHGWRQLWQPRLLGTPRLQAQV